MAMEQSNGKKRLVLRKIASVARSRQRQKPDKVGYHFNRPTCLRPSINHRVSILFFSSSVSSGSTQTLLLFFLPDDTPIPAPTPSSLASLRSPRPRPLLFARHQPPTSHHRPPTHLADTPGADPARFPAHSHNHVGRGVALPVRRFDKRREPVFAGLLHNHVQRSGMVRPHASGRPALLTLPATTSTPSTSATD
jgi:hypothetical protein